MAVSADGFYTAATSSEAEIHFIDKLGKLYWSHRIENRAASMAMSASGDYVAVGLAAGAHPGQVSLFHRAEGLVWRYITGEASVCALAIDSTGAFIAAGTEGGDLLLFHRNQKMVWKQRLEGSVSALAMSSDGSKILAGTRKGATQMLDASTAVEELRPKTEEAVELEPSLFRPLRSPLAKQGAGAPAPAQPQAAPAASGVAETGMSRQARRTLEIVVDVCLLVVLGLILTVFYFTYTTGIEPSVGITLLIFLLVVMGTLLVLLSKYVLYRPKKKGPSIY